MKNANTNYTSFELNCGFHLQIFYKKDVNICFQLKLVDKLINKLKKLMIVYKKNLQHIQKFQKHYHNKYIKFKSHTSNEKVWLNSKYIKIR